MPKFGPTSLANLENIDEVLYGTANLVIKVWDSTAIDGIRTATEQAKNVAKGVSKTMDSKHLPREDGKSDALDIMPYPLNWNAVQRGYDAVKRLPIQDAMAVLEAYAFAGFFDGVAWGKYGINLRSGYDWNTNRQFEDQTFLDLPHHELR